MNAASSAVLGYSVILAPSPRKPCHSSPSSSSHGGAYSVRAVRSFTVSVIGTIGACGLVMVDELTGGGCRRMLRVSREVEDSNRRMLRARDAMDRNFAEPLDVPALARVAHVSAAHFIRTFRATFGETPHRYLQRRRVERAMAMLRQTDDSISEICLDVGFASLGSFSRTFRDIVGESPTTYRWRAKDLRAVPACFAKAWTRPSSFGEA